MSQNAHLRMFEQQKVARCANLATQSYTCAIPPGSSPDVKNDVLTALVQGTDLGDEKNLVWKWTSESSLVNTLTPSILGLRSSCTIMQNLSA